MNKPPVKSAGASSMPPPPPGPGVMTAPSAGKIDGKTVRRLLGYLKAYRVKLGVVILCIVLSALASVASSLFLQTLIDDYIAPLLLESVPNYSGLLHAIGVMAVIYLVGVASTLFYNRTMTVIAQSVLKDIRDQMFSSMQKLPIRYFDAHSHGDVMSHYTNDADTLRQMLAISVPQAISSVITIGAVFCSMLYLSVYLTLFVVVFVFFMLRLTRLIAGHSGVHFVHQQENLGDVNGYIEEMIHGQKVVKVFCRERQAVEAFDRKNDMLCGSATLANIYANILMPVMQALGYILYLSIAVVGGFMAISGVRNIGLAGAGVLTLGMISSFLQLTRSFANPISQVSQQFNSVVMALAGAGRIFQLMDEKPETDDGYVTLVRAKQENGSWRETAGKGGRWVWKHPHHDGSLTYSELKGEVRLCDVDFAYEAGKPVLHNITLYAEPGQKVAFVGATGAGKTTITNLINRFYDIDDGKVRYDGININKIKKADLRQSLGVVLQDVHLFTGTVMDNIRYGRLDATDEECIAAAKLVNAHGFIEMLPKGYDTVLSGEGSGLSQGQRQLLSIARAAVADPPVMILDEATSSIDTRTEAIVQRGMDALMEGRTVFVIAHRLSTVRNSDVIMVLDHGKIIERGSHDKLIAEKGMYYQLYTGAFELE